MSDFIRRVITIEYALASQLINLLYSDSINLRHEWLYVENSSNLPTRTII